MQTVGCTGPGRPLLRPVTTAHHHTCLLATRTSPSPCQLQQGICLKPLRSLKDESSASGASGARTRTLEKPALTASVAQQPQQPTVDAGQLQMDARSVASQSAQKQWQTQAPRTLMYYLRLLKWRNLKPEDLGFTMLFVLGVILVNYGVESMLDYYLGTDNPLGSCLCILTGASVLIMMKIKRIPVSRVLLAGFWS